LCLLLSGCAQWGGRVLENNHVAFNEAVADSMDKQMLLNVVRLSKSASTQWLMVSSINVNTSVSANANASINSEAASVPGVTSGGGVGGGFNYTPNITYIPRQGEELAKEMMSPVPVDSIEKMVSAGWPISWVIFLTCERVQRITSFDVTFGTTMGLDDAKFGRLLELVDLLQERQMVSLSLTPQGVTWNDQPIPETEVTLDRLIQSEKDRIFYRKRPDGAGYDLVSIASVPVFTVYPEAEKIPEGKEFCQMMELPGPGDYRLVSVENAPLEGKRISIRTRSLAALMRLMSYGVDAEAGAPSPSPNVDSPTELWKHMQQVNFANYNAAHDVRAVFRIHRDTSMPDDSTVQVPFDGDWYWINDKDVTSKAIFALVTDLYNLQVKSDNSIAPVLTIPVGR
jgi:hypothetical protein